MEDKGLLTGIYLLFAYPVESIIAIIKLVVLYPVVVLIGLFNPDTP